MVFVARKAIIGQDETENWIISRLYQQSYPGHFKLRQKQLPSNLWLSRAVLGHKIVDQSDEVGASPVGTAPTTSSFST